MLNRGRHELLREYTKFQLFNVCMKKGHCTLKELVKSQFPDLTEKQIFSMILCGDILADGQKIRDSQFKLSKSCIIQLKPGKPYVSRGGEKLFPILDYWKIRIKGKVFIDAGASTGGFTDCLLKEGAEFVYAVDVGPNQLAYELQHHPRVKSLERTNIMELDHLSFDPQPDAAFADLSFRSTVGAASNLLLLVKEKWIVALIKPQFEWANPSREFNGVIKNREILINVLFNVVDRMWKEESYVSKVKPSPIRGAKGNREFFFLIKSKCEKDKDDVKAELVEII